MYSSHITMAIRIQEQQMKDEFGISKREVSVTLTCGPMPRVLLPYHLKNWKKNGAYSRKPMYHMLVSAIYIHT